MNRVLAPARPADLAVRQREHRHVCVRAGVVSLAARPVVGGRRGLLVDVSASGIGLLLESPLEAGTALAVQLPGDGVEARPARVTHCRPSPAPADAPWLTWRDRLALRACRLLGLPDPAAGRAWLVGCEFGRPLTTEELREVLAAAGPVWRRPFPRRPGFCYHPVGPCRVRGGRPCPGRSGSRCPRGGRFRLRGQPPGPGRRASSACTTRWQRQAADCSPGRSSTSNRPRS